MDDLTQVYDALRKADAAGNDEDAKRLADYIRSVSAGAPAPDTRPLVDQIPGTKPVAPYKEPSVGEMAEGVAHAGMGLLESGIQGIGAAGWGVGKDIYERATGNAPAGVNQQDKYFDEFIKAVPIHQMPPLGQEYLQDVGSALSVFPAFMPEVPGGGLVAPAIGQAARAAAPVVQGAVDLTKGAGRKVAGAVEKVSPTLRSSAARAATELANKGIVTEALKRLASRRLRPRTRRTTP